MWDPVLTSRLRSALWAALLLAVGGLAPWLPPASPIVRLPGGHMWCCGSTSTLEGVRWNPIARVASGWVVLEGGDAASGLAIERCDVQVIDEVTWRIRSTPSDVRGRIAREDGTVILRVVAPELPQGTRPYGIDVGVSFTKADGTAGDHGMAWGMFAADPVDDDAIERLAARGGCAVPQLLEDLASYDPNAREVAVIVAKRLGRQAADTAPLLVALLEDRHTKVRSRAVTALGYVGDATVVPHLVTRAADPDELHTVRWGAVRALRELGPEAAAATPLLARLVDGEPTSMRLAALHAIASIGPGASGALPALERLDASDVSCVNTREALEAALAEVRAR